MIRYKTIDGDVLDALCMTQYGRTVGVVEAVLEANPGLAELGPVYEAGVEVVFPDLPEPEPEHGVSLWD